MVRLKVTNDVGGGRRRNAAACVLDVEFAYEPDDGALAEAIAILLRDDVLPVDRGEAA